MGVRYSVISLVLQTGQLLYNDTVVKLLIEQLRISCVSERKHRRLPTDNNSPPGDTGDDG